MDKKFVKQANLPDAAYPPKFDAFSYYKEKATDKEEKRWCKFHPTSFWGKRSDGEWFAKCVYGNKFNEDCEVGE